MRQIVFGVILLLLVCNSVVAQATTYYISPTGSNSSDGLSPGASFRTFAYALDPTRASCGDTLNLANGVYGDGTSTGKISLSGRTCTAGSPLTIRAVNQRQARINDNGTGQAIKLSSLTAFIIVDGLVANSTNNTSVTGSGEGAPFNANNTDHITVKNSLFYNPNKYTNTSVVVFVNSRDALVEDVEVYDTPRHCVSFFASKNMVGRRIYCHSRIGAIPGGYEGGTFVVGGAGAVVALYPCQDCIAENIISDGRTELSEMNAPFYENLIMRGKLLGSISVGPGNPGNSVYLSSRDVADANHSPTNILIQDVAIWNKTDGACIRNTSGVNVTINRVTCDGGATTTSRGFFNDKAADRGSPTPSFRITNSIAQNWVSGFAFYSLGYPTWSGNNLFSFNNPSDFSPALPSNWGTAVTTNPGLGTCRAWAPDGSAAKIAEAGATILYRYQDGRLTNVPLWNPTTGEFPHGALVAGVNDVAGQSLFDVHKRLNVNTNGCSFPANYGDGVTDVDAPSTPAGLRLF